MPLECGATAAVKEPLTVKSITSKLLALNNICAKRIEKEHEL
jgi:hypothetical protein